MPAQLTDHVFAGTGIFRDVAPADREALASELETMPLRRGDVLMRQGDDADALYIVVSGRFEVRLDGRSEAVAEIGPGSPIGEIAFLAGGTRTATVVALRDSLVLRLGRAEFDRLCQRAPQIWRALTATLAQRLADQTAGRSAISAPVPRTVTVIPAGSKPIPERFIDLLETAFASAGRSLVVRSVNIERHIGAAAQNIAGAAGTEALNALESRHDVVIYVADRELTPWSEKAIRQADVVLRVGRAQTDDDGIVAESPHEALAARLLPTSAQRLVLLHERRQAPRGTRRWLVGRHVKMHHHVALSDGTDVERLVRFLMGRALGLVACGGGAFCAAHVGIYEALLDAGVAFDIMGGTSGGSAMAAAFAMGHLPDDIDRTTHDIFVTRGALKRYTIPRYSLIDHTHFDRLLAEHYAGVDIEDLWIPYFAISTNLSRYSVHSHVSGDLWEAIRASGSIPALLPPFYTSDGQMLVDGCLLDNVPIQAMREMKSGPNVVVAFEVPQLERFDVDYRALPSRGALLRRLLQPFGRKPLPPAPSMASVLLRSMMANRQGFDRHLRQDDLLIVPPLPVDMSVLDWGRHEELRRNAEAWCIEEIARRAGHPALARRDDGARNRIAPVTPASRAR